MRTRRRATDELALTIRCLPRATRLAMLEGIATNPIIAGAYSSREGICPMLAAHRVGGRTNLIAFAEAWDRFAQRDRRLRRSRRATERELNFLRAHLEASLMEDDEVPPLGDVIAEHQKLLEAPAPRQRTRPGASTAGNPDRDRSRELRGRPGWAWTRLFRRYDEYRDAMVELEKPAAERMPRSPAGTRA
jgi:hypothetical protein